MPTACCPASWDQKNGGFDPDFGLRDGDGLRVADQAVQIFISLKYKEEFSGRAVLPGSPLIPDLRRDQQEPADGHRPKADKR